MRIMPSIETITDYYLTVWYIRWTFFELKTTATMRNIELNLWNRTSDTCEKIVYILEVAVLFKDYVCEDKAIFKH